MPSPCLRQRHYRFSLIELLVVISVVALLASLLLPALSRAREKVRSINCVSNLKQIHLAFDSYLEANREWYPRYLDWRSKISPPLNGGKPWPGFLPLNTMPRTLICPSGRNKIVTPDASAPNNPNIFYRKWLLHAGSPAWPIHVIRSTGIFDPSVAIVSYCDWKNGFIETMPGHPPLFPNTHDTGRNIHHADGHVETYKEFVEHIPDHIHGPLYRGWYLNTLRVDP